MDRWRAWDEFLEARPDTGFMQASWWADFRADAGYGHFASILKHQGAILGGALVMKFWPTPLSCFYYIPDGPVLPADEAEAEEVFQVLLGAIEAERKTETVTVSHLRIEPRWERLPPFVSGFHAVPAVGEGCREPRRTLCIDLRPSEAEILAQMKRNGRYNIRVAQKHGVSVVEDKSERGLADFLAIYAETAVRQKMNAKPPEYFEALLNTLSSAQKGSVFFAEYQGRRLAAAIVVYFARKATYLFGASLATHRQVKAADVLQFEIMRRARARGYEWYDLWGIAPEDAPTHPWWDFSMFKRKFGGQEFNIVPTLDYIYDPASYEQYVAT
jgi:lipid II:glycine glycyltransferase (peptidoglycan interpeptide bridge formation enzyme)